MSKTSQKNLRYFVSVYHWYSDIFIVFITVLQKLFEVHSTIYTASLGTLKTTLTQEANDKFCGTKGWAVSFPVCPQEQHVNLTEELNSWKRILKLLDRYSRSRYEVLWEKAEKSWICCRNSCSGKNMYSLLMLSTC